MLGLVAVRPAAFTYQHVCVLGEILAGVRLDDALERASRIELGGGCCDSHWWKSFDGERDVCVLRQIQAGDGGMQRDAAELGGARSGAAVRAEGAYPGLPGRGVGSKGHFYSKTAFDSGIRLNYVLDKRSFVGH